jgi:hypothetical protein
VLYKTLYYYLCYYHKVRMLFCIAIISQYESFALSQTDADVIPLPGRSSLFESLKLPKPRYFCLHCDFATYS